MVVLAHLHAGRALPPSVRVGRHHHRGPLHLKVKASHTPSLTVTPLPLTSPSPQRSVGEEGILQAAALAPVAETAEKI